MSSSLAVKIIVKESIQGSVATLPISPAKYCEHYMRSDFDGQWFWSSCRVDGMQ